MSNDEFPKPRQVLGDLTNCPAKRGFSLISSDVGLTSSSVHGKNIEHEDMDLRIVKHRHLGVDNVIGKKCRQSDDENDMPLLKGKEACGLLHPYTNTISSQESITSAMPNMPSEVQDKRDLLEDNKNSANDIVATQSLLEICDASRDSSASTVSVPADSEPYNGVVDSQDGEIVPLDVIHSSCIVGSSGEDLGVGKLGSSNYGSVDWLKLPKSQGSKGFSLERCTQDNADGCANFDNVDGAFKECACPFCLKAAYIWSDLHYQDIKGRIAALKKSRKEASALVQNNTRGKDVDIHGDGNSNTSSMLESDLTSQWKSLFVHMEDILIRESNQLQAGFETLKELREKCKTDLETMNAMPMPGDKE